ncbi:MAG: choice-of-anchor J domain-containing protein, partial [Bacteroidota bacterium]
MRLLVTLLLASCWALTPALAQQADQTYSKSETRLSALPTIPELSESDTFRGTSSISRQVAPLGADFEDGVFPPPGWAVFDNGNGTANDWFLVNLGTPTTPAIVAYNPFENVASGVAEDYLVTPRIRPSLGDATLSFDAAQQFADPFGSQYLIQVSTGDQTTIGDFTTIQTYTEADLPVFTAGLQRFNVDLSAFIGQDIFVAFVHVNDDGDSWFVDNITGPELVVATAAPDCAENHAPVDGATGVTHGILVTTWDPPSAGATVLNYSS